MIKKLFKYEIIGFIFVSFFGTLSHFFFEWSNESQIIALFCPVNESAWEHLKLIFFAYMFYSVFEYIIFNRKAGMLFCKSLGVIFGMFTILSLFYLYNGIIGKNINFLNIVIFFIGVISAFLLDYILIRSEKFNKNIFDVIAVIIYVAISCIFFLTTFAPPFIPLFKDPTNQSYGI